MAPVLCGISGLSRVIENLFAVTADIISLLYRHGCKERDRLRLMGGKLTQERRNMVKNAESNKEKKKESPLVSLLVSIVIPAIILSKFSTEEYLGILPGFLVALSLPIGYAIYNLVVRKETGFIAILGFVSIFLTGIIGVFEFPTEWLAIKEAAVPLLIGIAVIVSLKTPYPLVRKLIFNE